MKNTDSVTTRVAVLETTIEHINASLQRIEHRFDTLDTYLRWGLIAAIAISVSPMFPHIAKLIREFLLN